jgi:hypothetical protein
MKRLTLALFLAVAACQSGGGYDGPYPFQPVWTPPQPAQQMIPTQTYFLPGGRMMNCTTYGTVTSCY